MLFLFLVMTTGCGADLTNSLPFGLGPQPEKLRCDQTSSSFHVCLNPDSVFQKREVRNAILQAMGLLNELVPEPEFLDTVSDYYSNGKIVENKQIDGRLVREDLVGTNYQITIEEICESNGTQYARATVGGSTILYNGCLVKRNGNGEIRLPHVAGVLLHEIAHNINYDHDEIDPEPDTVPYFLGRTAEAWLGGEVTEHESIDIRARKRMRNRSPRENQSQDSSSQLWRGMSREFEHHHHCSHH